MTLSICPPLRRKPREWFWFLLGGAALAPMKAHASLLHGEALDKMADIMTWVVLIVVPIVGLVAFWLVHILPEKIAEKKHHPQTKGIQCLCLLSLCFGGLLWPLAWLWAYTKPVLHQLAYGTDVDKSHGHEGKPAATDISDENEILRERIAQLEAQLNAKGGPS